MNLKQALAFSVAAVMVYLSYFIMFRSVSELSESTKGETYVVQNSLRSEIELFEAWSLFAKSSLADTVHRDSPCQQQQCVLEVVFMEPPKSDHFSEVAIAG